MQIRQQDISQRGHGFTTLQIQHAPQGALFICPARGAINHTKALAASIGRDDLKIVGPEILDRHAERLRGCRYPSIVLDHACEPSGEEYALLREVRAWCVPADSPERHI